MRVLVWQWGRRGAGPRFAVALAESLRLVPGVEAALSLSTGAEILRGANPPRCELPFSTYESPAGFVRRLAAAPFARPGLSAALRRLQPDFAICAMPAPLDLVFASALRHTAIPFLVVVHDADPHPGDVFPLQMRLQRQLARQADGLIALTGHVANRLRQQGLAGGGRRCKPLFLASLPPFVFGPAPAPPRCHAGPFRLLSFGRLLPYKGLDLLAEALVQLGPRADLQVRVVGSGPESETLRQLRMLPGVAVENRWVPEDEVGSLLAWADGLVLSHKEASQSGVAAAAVAAGRWVLATRVGGLVEQLQYETLAVFCDPNPLSLASALGSLLAAPPPSLQPSRDPHAAWRNVAESLIAQIESTLLPGSGGKPCRSMPSIITSRICQNRANSGSPLMRT